jgi:predicted  nucleic acid-binding Zn-ribbon protein
MPHQCVRCNTFYDDGAKEILSGCECGAKLFFYVKKEKLEEMKKISKDANLSDKDKQQIEKDVMELVGQDHDPSAPVVLDIESIKIIKPGKYELDLVHLFKGDPLIFKLGEGKYMIDVVQSFRQGQKKK